MMTGLFENRALSRLCLFIVSGALLFGTVGPFGQVHRFELFERIGLWFVYLLVGLPLFIGSQRLLAGLAGLRSSLFLVPLSSLAACLPMLLLVELMGYSQGRPFPETLPAFLHAALEVCLAGGVLLFAWELLTRQLPEQPGLTTGERADLPAPALQPAMPPALSTALGPGFGPALHALRAEGHYTRAFGERGDRLVDMAISEALSHLAPCDGEQVHRSWWVARKAVLQGRRKGSAAELELQDGTRVPVARRRITQLRADGWPV